MLIFKCPKCEDSLMGFNEADNSWICTAGECQHEMAAEEADALFEAGELLGVVESNSEDVSEEEDADDEDEDDDPVEEQEEEDDEGDEEEEEEDDMEESFHGFSNADTWALNLLVQNEYKVYKGAANVIADSEDSEKALKSFVTKSVLKNKDYADVLEMIDPKKVVWGEIVTSVNEAAKEFADIRGDLEKALSQNEDLNESERKNVALVFESALAVKYNDMKAKLEEKFQVDLDKKVEETAAKLTEEMSGYLDEVVQEWMEDNKLAIQNGIQLEKNHLFMDGLRDLFEKHYIDVPEERFDILEDMSDKIEQMDEQLSDAKAHEAELQEKLDLVRPTTIAQASRIEGMTPAALVLLAGVSRRQLSEKTA